MDGQQNDTVTTRRNGSRWLGWLGRLVRAALLLVLSLLTVAAVAVAWLTQTDPGRAVLLRTALGAVNGNVLQGELVVQRVEGPIFRRLALVDATLYDESGAVLATLDRIEAQWRLLPLLRATVVVPSVDIVGLDVRARILRDGGLNLARIVAPGEPAPPSDGPGWTVSLPQIRVDETAFVLRDARNADARLVVVDSFRLNASFDLARDGTISVHVAELGAGLAPPIALEERFPVFVRELGFTIVGSEMAVSIGELAAASTSLRGLEATVDLGTDDQIFGRVDMELPTLHIDPDDVNAVLPELRLLAPVTLTASLGGPPEKVTFEATLTGPEGEIVAGANLDISAPATPGYSFSIEARGLEPNRWLDLGGLDAEVTGRVEFSGRGITPDDALLGLSLDLQGSRLGGVVVDKAIARIGYSAGTLRIEPMDAAIAGVSLRARGTASIEGAVDVAVSLDAPDLSTLRAAHPALADLAGAVSVELGVAGAVAPDALRELPASPLELVRWLAARLEVSLAIEASGVRAPGVVVQQAEIALDSPASSPPQVDLSVDAAGVAAGGLLLDRIGLSSSLRNDALELQLAATEAATGRSIRTSMRVTGEGRDVDVLVRTLDADVPPVRVQTTSAASVALSLNDDWAPVAVELDSLRALVSGAQLAVDGRWAANGRVAAVVAAEELVFEQLLPALGIDLPLEGRLAANLTLGGTLLQPELSLDIGVSGMRWAQLGGIDVALRAGYAGRALRTSALVSLADAPLVRLETTGPGLPLRINLAEGTFAFDMRRPMGIALGIEPLDLSQIAAVVPALASLGIRGSLAAAVSIGGSGASPLGQAALRLDNGGVDLPLAEGGVWELRDVSLGASADYGVKYEGQALARARLSWEGTDLLVLAGNSGLEVGRLVAGEIGWSDWLAGLNGEIDVEIPAFDLGRLPRTVRELTGVRDGTVVGSARWRGTPSRGELIAHAEASRLRIGMMPAVDASIDLSGDEVVRFDLRSVVDVGGIGSPWFGVAAHDPSSTALLEPSDPRAAVRLHGEVGASLRSLLRGGFGVDVPLRARAHIPGAPIALLSLVLDDPLPSTDGQVRGWLDLVGTARAPELGGRIALRDLALLDGSRGAVGVELAADASSLVARIETCGGDGRTLQAEAHAEWPTAAPLVGDDLQLAIPPLDSVQLVDAWARAEGAQIASLAPAFLAGTLVEEMRGFVSLDVTASGSAAAPQVAGELGLTELDVGVIPLGRRFEDIELQLSFSNDHIALRELQIRDGAGRVTGQGELELQGFAPTRLDAALRFRDFLVADPEGNGVFVDGRAVITGGMQDDVLAAEVVLRDVSLTVPAQAPPSTGPTAPPGPVYFVGEDIDATQVGASDPILLAAADTETSTGTPPIDIRIRSEGRNYVYHSLAEVQFVVDLLATLRSGEFRLDGNVEVPSGRVTFAGKAFDITRGIVQFDGQPNEVNPVIDVEATHYLSGSIASRLPAPSGERSLVRVTVNGDLEQVLTSSGEAVRLQSDPEMSKQDVLFVLLTGRPRNDDNAVGAEQQALATAGSLLLGLLGDRLLDGMPIDTLRIEGDSQTGQAISRVEGGKYISDDVYVSGSYINSQDPEDNDFEFALEWIIARFARASIRTELRAGNRAKGGVELLYQFLRAGRSRVPAASTGGDEAY